MRTMRGNQAAQQEYRKSGRESQISTKTLKWLMQQRLLLCAARWRVYVPHEQQALWTRTYHRKRRMLTSAAQDQIREQIWQRRITVFGIVIGASSIVQAVYAALSFHLH